MKSIMAILLLIATLRACEDTDSDTDTDTGDTASSFTGDTGTPLVCDVAPCIPTDPNGFRIESQADLDALYTCTEIQGYVKIIEQGWVTTIDLPCLETTEQGFVIVDTSVSSISAPRYAEADGALAIQLNPNLTDLDGFPSLSNVNGVSILQNEGLISLEGIHGLTVRGTSHIENNPALCRSDVRAWLSSSTVLNLAPDGTVSPTDGIRHEGNDDGC